MDGLTAAMRRTAKTVNFGIIYGVTAHGLEQRTDLNYKESAEFIENYLNTYAGVREYTEKTKQFAHEHGYVETLLGRRRYLRELQASNVNVRQAAERMAINMPVQGTSADIIKVAMLHVADQLAATGIPVRMLPAGAWMSSFSNATCGGFGRVRRSGGAAHGKCRHARRAGEGWMPKVGASWGRYGATAREFSDYGRRIRAGARPGERRSVP